MVTLRPTWVEINLANLAFNFQQVKKLVGKKVKVLAAVKANAYGHGILEVSRRLAKCGVDYLGVANVDEAAILRKAGIKTPVLILSTLFSYAEIKLALKLKTIMTIADFRSARMLNYYAKVTDKPKVHIKVDTGMGRLGIWHAQAEDLINRILKLKKLQIDGIYTHFPSADTDPKFTHKQIDIFKKLLQRLEKKGLHIPFSHAANSLAVCRIKPSYLNMVRPGIMLYGMYPDLKLRKVLKLKPVLSFKTRVTYLKEVTAGRSISYGRTYITKKKTRIATIPVGYADGYARALSNKAKVLINGKFVPVVGRICMDQTMVDVGALAELELGDTVTLIGKQKGKLIAAEELAALCKTIPYEITCWISSRVRRVFKNN